MNPLYFPVVYMLPLAKFRWMQRLFVTPAVAAVHGRLFILLLLAGNACTAHDRPGGLGAGVWGPKILLRIYR